MFGCLTAVVGRLLYFFRSIPLGIISTWRSDNVLKYLVAASDTAVNSLKYFIIGFVYGVTTFLIDLLVMLSNESACSVAIFTAFERCTNCWPQNGTHGS